MAKPELTQREMKERIEVGGWGVMSVGSWYKLGHFDNDDQAKGAFELAWQQTQDGMGKTPEEWMGLTTEELSAWHRDGTLPAKKKR